jgi:hypothetical protein
MSVTTIIDQEKWDKIEPGHEQFVPAFVKQEFPDINTIAEHVIKNWKRAAQTYNFQLRKLRKQKENDSKDKYYEKNEQSVVTYKRYLELVQGVKFNEKFYIEIPTSETYVYDTSFI